MKVGLHTIDLFPGRERLMPFRTILEVAKVMRQQGWEADILNSSSSEKKIKNFEWENVKIVQCPRDFKQLSFWVNERKYDVFFYAATIREGLRNLAGFREMKCRKIAYIASGITFKENSWWLCRLYGMYAKAWILEAFTPKKLLGKKLRKSGFTDVIGLTEYTTREVNGQIATHTIYPGKDDFEFIKSDDSVLLAKGLKKQKFYLFTGGPAEVRGSLVLLKAFDQMANDIPEALLVVLMRHDVGGKNESFNATLNSTNHRANVIFLEESLSREQLKAFFEEAYAVVLPFICIPAEIPLTYYEVMSCGTPVVSFKNGGTTDYLHDGLMLCPQTNLTGLTSALKTLWYSPKLRGRLSQRAKEIMCTHPTWKQVGDEWIGVVTTVV